jgi:putative heme-binding domain-containing protein
MPAFSRMAREELGDLIAFIRRLQGSGTKPASVAGDAKRGRALYAKHGCPACHRIGEEGSDYGPDLTRIGAARSLEYLTHSITEPSGDIPEEYQGVTVVAKDGKRVSGMRVNEDTFTVQVRDMSQKIHAFDKAGVRDVVHEKNSMMPAYNPGKQDLNDMLAYLVTLRGPVRSGGAARKVEGIQ